LRYVTAEDIPAGARYPPQAAEESGQTDPPKVERAALFSLACNPVEGSGHNNGNVMQITNNLYPDNSRTFTFGYDQLNRLKTAATSAGTATYTDDIWGNLSMISLPGSLPWQNALSLGILTNNRISGDGYDSAGNMTSDGLYSYTYNAENQQTSTTAGGTYTYDGDGKRVMKTSEGGRIFWYGLNSEPLLETDLAGDYLVEYVFLNGQRLVRRDMYGGIYYYLADHLGSTRMIFNSSGAVCYDADFGPYGKEWSHTDTCGGKFKFTGKERDTETGNDYFGARYYENNLGRFMSADVFSRKLLANPQSLNRYAYVMNNPTTLADPLGLAPCQKGDPGCHANDDVVLPYGCIPGREVSCAIVSPVQQDEEARYIQQVAQAFYGNNGVQTVVAPDGTVLYRIPGSTVTTTDNQGDTTTTSTPGQWVTFGNLSDEQQSHVGLLQLAFGSNVAYTWVGPKGMAKFYGYSAAVGAGGIAAPVARDAVYEGAIAANAEYPEAVSFANGLAKGFLTSAPPTNSFGSSPGSAGVAVRV
jgi:RHS repeat-associated protein